MPSIQKIPSLVCVQEVLNPEFWISFLLPFAALLLPLWQFIKNQTRVSKENGGERLVLGLASLKCMQTYLFLLWYSPYYVLCIFKCVKHHACLAGPWDSRWKRDRLCFLSHGDFALVFLYHFVGLSRKLVKTLLCFTSLFTFYVPKEQNAHFHPAQGNARKRKCAKPQCKKQCILHCRAFSQQTGRLHAHIGNC